MTETVQQYYIPNPAAVSPEPTLVLKQGETFAVFNHFGDIDTAARSDEGLYHRGTRHLSRLALLIAGGRPLLLSSDVQRNNLVASADLTNPDIWRAGQVVLPHSALHIFRAKLLGDGMWLERLHLRNFGSEAVSVPITLQCAADYVDIFEVRGQHRARRGVLQEPRVFRSGFELGYLGLDGTLRRTVVECTPPPSRSTGSSLEVVAPLASREERIIEVTVACETGSRRTARRARAKFAEILDAKEAVLEETRRDMCAISSSNAQFDAWLERSLVDLGMLLTTTDAGPYPYAGVPWFDATFGRDGIITALQSLWLAPRIARGVLAFLAAHQATESEPERDAEPGKILHEARHGEMAALGEIPFGCYYGSVDATPLYVMLAAAYLRRTGDRDFIASIWPSIRAALAWIDTYGDRDGDGFVEYYRRTPSGLAHQGWKDSHDSVFHEDGTFAEGPIALCEVQGYVFAAKRGAATIAEALGLDDDAARLEGEAGALQDRFERSFWCEELGTYVLALDGSKRPCRVRTSNPGHCLYAGITADRDRAVGIAERFAQEPYFSGWGVRTVAAGEARYNPMAYHNGSIWPHDNALIAAGAARYGLRQLALQILAAQFEASTFFTSYRLPELFCGFHRRLGRAPTSYPVACSPQAWASGAAFMLLEACLGLSIDAARRTLYVERPALPPFIELLRLRRLRVGDGCLDVTLRRRGDTVSLDIDHREGDAEVVLKS